MTYVCLICRQWELGNDSWDAVTVPIVTADLMRDHFEETHSRQAHRMFEFVRELV